MRIFGKGKCKFIANFSATLVTSLPSLSVSLSLSHRKYIPHAQYRKRGSASYIVREVVSVREKERERDTEREREIQRERERERERDGSDVTIVAQKLAMNLRFSLPNIRTIGDELTLSLAKNSHFSFLPSPLPVSPFAERSPWWR